MSVLRAYSWKIPECVMVAGDGSSWRGKGDGRSVAAGRLLDAPGGRPLRVEVARSGHDNHRIGFKIRHPGHGAVRELEPVYCGSAFAIQCRWVGELPCRSG